MAAAAVGAWSACPLPVCAPGYAGGVTQVHDGAPAERPDAPRSRDLASATPVPAASREAHPRAQHATAPGACPEARGAAAPSDAAPGLFISFEGGDGVGKTTQIRILADLLTAAGVDHVLTREPGGTELGGAIRELLLHGGEVDPRAEALLYAADRAHHVATLIRPALRRGAVVLTDRYIDSSVAYQGAARSLGAQEVRALSQWAVSGLLPDLTILLDADPDLAARRTVARGTKDRLEREPDAFRAALRRAFLEMAAQDPARFVVVDADRPVDQVADDVIEAAVSAVRSHGARFAGGVYQSVLVGLEAFVAAADSHRRGSR